VLNFETFSLDNFVIYSTVCTELFIVEQLNRRDKNNGQVLSITYIRNFCGINTR